MSIFKRLYNIARAEVHSRIRSGVEEPRTWQKAENNEQDDAPPHDDAYQSPPPGQDEQLASWYAALELAYGSDFKAVQRSWKKLQRQYHPDMHASDPDKQKIAHTVSQQINEAYFGLKKHLGD